MSNPPAGSVSLVGNANRVGHQRYVLITPTRDEMATIELTLKSVVGQTVRPVRWVIVSDQMTKKPMVVGGADDFFRLSLVDGMAPGEGRVT